MIQFCSNICSSLSTWKEEFMEKHSDWMGHSWNYYTQERAVIKGFPFAVVSTLAASYLFKGVTFTSGALFGAVNYLTLTSLLEVIRAHHEIDKTKAFLILGISGAISTAFIQKVCKTTLSYEGAILLSVAAFAGQLSREFLMNEDYE